MDTKILIAQLRERRLLQILALYGAAAWVIVEIVGFFVSAYELPRYVLDIVVFLALSGVLGALILIWYHGKRGHQRFVRSEKLLLAALALFMVAGAYQIATADPLKAFNRLAGSRVILDFPTIPPEEFSRTFDLRAEGKLSEQVHESGTRWVIPDPERLQITLPSGSVVVEGRPLMVDPAHEAARGRIVVVVPQLPTQAEPDSLDKYDLEILGLAISVQAPVVTKLYGDTLIVRLINPTPSTQTADTATRPSSVR